MTLAEAAVAGIPSITPIPLPEVQGDRGVLYLRLSEDELARGADVDEALIRAELDRQRKPALRLAKKQGIRIVGEYVDIDKSAYSDKPRPDFERLLLDAPHGAFDFVVIWGSDRLYRRLRDLTRITDQLARHVRILVAKEQEIDLTTAAGILQAQILGALGEFESRRKGERLVERHQQRVNDERRSTASTRPVGWAWVDPCPAGEACEHKRRCKESEAGRRPRFGSRAGLMPHPVEGPLLAECYQKVADGAALRSLIPLWDHLEVVPRVTSLRSALLCHRNAGLVSFKGKAVAEAADGRRLVSVELWQQVRNILEDPRRLNRPGRPVKNYLSSILRCALCQGPMNGTYMWSGGKRTHPAYICGREQHFSRIRGPIDEAILAAVRAWISRDAEELLGRAMPSAGPAQAKAAAEVRALSDRLAALSEVYAAGNLPAPDYAATATKLRADLLAAQDRSVVASGRPAVARLLRSADPGAAWDGMLENVDEIRPILRELIAAVRISPEKGSGAEGRGLEIEWQEWAR